MILRLLAALIMFYRRWLSGRGPLRDVRCSFAAHESCSAFGMRATSEAPGAWTALGRIMRRMRRCRDACLISDGHALSWSPLHDRTPAEILDELRADGEGAAAIEQLLRVRRAVAVWRCDVLSVDACDALLTSFAGRSSAPRVCAEPSIRDRTRRRLVMLAVVAAISLAATFVLPWVGGITLGVAATAGTLSARTTLMRERRFDLHCTWARRRRTAGELDCASSAPVGTNRNVRPSGQMSALPAGDRAHVTTPTLRLCTRDRPDAERVREAAPDGDHAEHAPVPSTPVPRTFSAL